MNSGPLNAVNPLWAIAIRSFAFLRKEVVEIFRQPRLIALLVVGPFALLIMFGSGYSETTIQKRAIFVGPADSVYAEVLASYEEQLDEFIESQGLVDTEAEARAALEAGTTDVVVVFPPDPEASVLQGERAVIRVLHDEIDPIQEGAVEIAARLAIQEVNATVLATLARDASEDLPDSQTMARGLVEAEQRMDDDPVAARDELQRQLAVIGPALDGTETVLSRLVIDDPQLLDDVAETRRRLADVERRVDAVDDETTDAELRDLRSSVGELADQLDGTVVLDPNVLVRPFESATDNLVADRVTPTEYFTPASLALLLQHLALTFAALSLVRDRRTGLFELMRVGPLSSIEIIIGKIFAYLLVGSFVGATLVFGAIYGLEVEFFGSYAWLALVVVGVLLASLALGMVLSTLSGTESQAVQYAMLALLAGLFFGGFVLPIEGLQYPVKVISWLLPVTYGIETLQDIMLRGDDPARGTLLGLLALVVGYGALAIYGLRRRLRTGGAG